MQVRNNPVVWRIAKWLFHNLPVEYDDYMDWDSEWQKNKYYDKAVELLAKLYRNDFTGPDNHND